MTQGRIQRDTGTRSLVWLLLMAVMLMGLTITRQQALGSLHRHTGQELRAPSKLSTAVSSLASNWLNRWRQQQLFGHSELRTRLATDTTLWPSRATQLADHAHASGAHPETHQHDALERHHHAMGDGSVVALDGAAQAAEAADGGSSGASLVSPGVATPSAGLAMPDPHADKGPWPVDPGTAFATRSVAPALRPPAV